LQREWTIVKKIDRKEKFKKIEFVFLGNKLDFISKIVENKGSTYE